MRRSAYARGLRRRCLGAGAVRLLDGVVLDAVALDAMARGAARRAHELEAGDVVLDGCAFVVVVLAVLGEVEVCVSLRAGARVILAVVAPA